METVLHKGSDGFDVGRLQQALVEVGEPIAQEELSAQYYGTTTEAAVRQYQAAHGLTVDGVVGEHTRHALSGSHDKSFIAEGWHCRITEARPALRNMLKQAVDLIGTAETPLGSNRGPLIDGWNLAAGIPLGSPWCASFASSMYQLVTSEKPHLMPILGSAHKIAAWGRLRDLLVPATESVLPGDLGVILRGDGHGHVVILCSDLGGGRFASVEGNSGNATRGLIRDRSVFAVVVRPLLHEAST